MGTFYERIKYWQLQIIPLPTFFPCIACSISEKGIAHWKVSVGYGLLQAVVGLSVLAVNPLGLVAVIFLLAAYSGGFFAFGHLVRSSVLSD